VKVVERRVGKRLLEPIAAHHARSTPSLGTMTGLVARAQGVQQTPPGLAMPQGASSEMPKLRGPQPSASGARTPDFHIACDWSAAEEHHADGADTPCASASAIMAQVCFMLRSLEMKAAAPEPEDDAHTVPLPYGLFGAPHLTTASACRPPPGLPMLVSQPPPPQPVPMRPTNPAFVVSMGSIGYCGATGGGELGMRRSEHHLESDQEPRRVADGRWDHCASVGAIGHPYTCAEACKFHTKLRGCKDGALCTRCHACRWTRYHKKSAAAAATRSRLFLGRRLRPFGVERAGSPGTGRCATD